MSEEHESLAAYQLRIMSIIDTQSIGLKELMLLCVELCYDNPPLSKNNPLPCNQNQNP